MLYKVTDISRFVINYCNEMGVSVNNDKLQRFLYLIQMHYLKLTGKPCFKERIEAWVSGPVVPTAYYEFESYKNDDIPRIDKYPEIDPENIWDVREVEYNKNTVAKYDRNEIKKVIDKYSELPDFELETLVKNQSPWKDAICRGKKTEITIQSMVKYITNRDCNA